MADGDDRVLSVSHLNVKIQNQTILDNVSFDVKRGTTLAIIGPNGAGKTVLFRALLGLVPYTGSIVWASGVKMGYVPQRLSVGDLPISVKEFLSFKSNLNVAESLSSVGLDSREVLAKSLGVLSGGQLQRVLIAWAIVDRPNVLLFDEPTAGVDIDSEEAIYNMLRRLRKEVEMTILLISHDLHIVREYSDDMLAINRCTTFLGKSQSITDLDVQKILFGEPVCISG